MDGNSRALVVQDLAAHARDDHDGVQRTELLLVVDAQLCLTVRLFAHTASRVAWSVSFDTGEAFGVDPHAFSNEVDSRFSSTFPGTVMKPSQHAGRQPPPISHWIASNTFNRKASGTCS